MEAAAPTGGRLQHIADADDEDDREKLMNAS